MKIRIISFTDRGERLAGQLAKKLPGDAMRCASPLSLDEWTRQGFSEADALIFIGAVGIAVRAVAPFLRNKAADPAVVVMDEAAGHVISLLSGHLGGANDLTRRIASICGADPVITTATDVEGVFAVDAWARTQGCVIPDTRNIKAVSARLLRGESIRILSDWPVKGEPPARVDLTVRENVVSDEAEINEKYDVLVSIRPLNGHGMSEPGRRDPAPSGGNLLYIVPGILVLGIGCKKGIPEKTIEAVFKEFCTLGNISEEAFRLVCSVDLKAGEAGIIGFCKNHGWPFVTYSPGELQAVEGCFTASAFVKNVTGADNICERSAVLGSGGSLLLGKYASDGVTMAAAVSEFTPDWKDGFYSS